jgi:hypothetical protein
MALIFIVLFVLFWGGINVFRALSGRERWQLTKLALYSILCAALSTLVLISIVLLF